MEAAITTRRATVDDLEAILDNLMAGFASFLEFSPSGWVPPEPRPEVTARVLGEPGTWALIADNEDGLPIAHVSFTLARGEPFTETGGSWRTSDPVPGMAHLWQLFVQPAYWGQRIAARLHDAAIAEMVARGYERARLFTPAANERSRAFYERRGWTFHRGGPDPDLGLEPVEYRLELQPEPSAASPSAIENRPS